MASLLSNLVDNLTEEIQIINCEDCNCILQYEHVEGNLIIYKGLYCNEYYSKKLSEKVIRKFKNTFKFSKNEINKFILLLRKGVYPYEYINDWEKFNETALLKKEEFCSNLNLEDITNADYIHANRVCKDFKIKNLVVNIMTCILNVIHYFWQTFLKNLEKCV